MRLVRKDTQEEVKVGSIIPFGEGKVTITYAPKPHKPASEGKVSCSDGKFEVEYYASVWGLEWIEREDREAIENRETSRDES